MSTQKGAFNSSPPILWVWPYWKQGLGRCTQVKVSQTEPRSYWIWPSSRGWCGRKREIWTETQTLRGETMWKLRQRFELRCHNPRTAKDCRQTAEAPTEELHGLSHQSHLGSLALLTSWFPTSSFPDFKRVSSPCFKPSSLCSFATAAPEN